MFICLLLCAIHLYNLAVVDDWGVTSLVVSSSGTTNPVSFSIGGVNGFGMARAAPMKHKTTKNFILLGKMKLIVLLALVGAALAIPFDPFVGKKSSGVPDMIIPDFGGKSSYSPKSYSPKSYSPKSYSPKSYSPKS